MASVNKVILIGNLGANPELKYLPTGQAVCELRLATNESYTDNQGQRQDRTEWHRVSVWGKQGENCAQYLAKGRSCYIEGRLRTRSWDDKDGNKRYSTEIIADRVQFLGGPGGGGGGPGPGDDAGGGPPPQRQGGSMRQGGYGQQGQYGQANQGGGMRRNAPPPPQADGPPPDYDNFGPGGTDDDIPF